MSPQDALQRNRDFVALAGLPVHERVLDRLVDLLLDADEVLFMLEGEDAAGVRWVEPHVRRAFDELDAAMRRMTD